MMTRTTLFLVGVCVGAAVPVILKAVRPYGAYALAGGLLAYESLCDAAESAGEAVSVTVRNAREELNRKKSHHEEED